MSDQTVAEWVQEEKARLDEFAAFWVLGTIGDDPAAFPTSLPSGEWDEQYRCWNGG